MIFVSIDACENVAPISWAVVPTEKEYWWKFFFEFITEVFPRATVAGKVLIEIKASQQLLLPTFRKLFQLTVVSI